MIDLVHTRETLDRAMADDREAGRLRSTVDTLRVELEAARHELAGVRYQHELEADDVRRLEGVGWAALLSAVRGTRTGEVERERAEEVVARYALQSATARVTGLEARREEAARQLARLGDTAARRADAVRAHAEAVRATGSSPELEQVLDELGSVESEATEVGQALEAGRRAAGRLDAAREHLGSADSWSAYDTWFGGGLVSSAIKHDRLDVAGHRIASAQESLVDFARELADVAPAARLRADLGISPATRAFDVWFDNIFSDLSVRSRIKDSQRDVTAASSSVHEALGRLHLHAAELEQRRAQLRRRVEELVSPRG